MDTWAVLASGASLTPEAVERVRHLPCIAVNDAFTLAPWARALVAGDAAFWKHMPSAAAFAGDKWCATRRDDMPPAIRRMNPTLPPHTNSGLHALNQAVSYYGATRVLLLGVDLIGRHFFGDHKPPLKNPTTMRFQIFRDQFAAYARRMPAGVEVVNCSPISTLECFPMLSLDEALGAPATV